MVVLNLVVLKIALGVDKDYTVSGIILYIIFFNYELVFSFNNEYAFLFTVLNQVESNFCVRTIFTSKSYIGFEILVYLVSSNPGT